MKGAIVSHEKETSKDAVIISHEKESLKTVSHENGDV